MGCLKYLLRKEFIQFRRNTFLPRLVFVFPIAVMLIVPLIANMDVQGVDIALVDADHSAVSSRMLSHLDASPYFKVRSVTSDYNSAWRLMEEGRADIIVSIPEGFEHGMYSDDPKKIKVDANAVNSTKSGLGSQYVMLTIVSALSETAAEAGLTVSPDPINVRYYYNETLDYRFYMIPAFMIILVLMVCCFIPALNMVLEKENGTIEQINVTPVSKLEFTLGKLIPYWLIGLLVLSEGILTAGFVYGLWPEGNILAIYLSALLFAFAMSGFAIIIANGSDTMQQSIFVLFFFVMLFMLMSGLLTPLGSMPQWARSITVVFPPRYFVEILRAVYLKGTTVAELGPDYLALAAFAIVFGLIAALTYKKQG